MKTHYIFFILIFSVVFSKAQNSNLTPDSEISILTFGNGQSLNDAFGHNGIRVKTPYEDIVYDYGRFNFNAPNFYTNFARGKLLYWQGVSNYRDVIPFYKRHNRSIKEQVLNLTDEEKRRFYDFLINNSQPQNRDYLYDFFYDNCATKIRDVSEIVTKNNITFNTPKGFEEKTFRDLIQDNLYWNSWGSLGIDIALGSVIDKRAKPAEYMFLPKYISRFFSQATFKQSGESLVKKEHVIYKSKEQSNNSSFFLSPFFILTVLSLAILFITYKNYKNNKRSVWLDIILFLSTGIIGVLLLLLWFATDHTATAQNYNLLWAFPLSLLGVFNVRKQQPASWFIKYLKFLIIMLCLLSFHWIIGIQHFALALIPLLFALLVRYIYLIRYYKQSI